MTEQEQRDSYAIYSLLLKQYDTGESGPPLGIPQDTVIFQPHGASDPYPAWPVPTPDQRRTYEPLIADFKERNALPLRLERRFALSAYRLLTPSEAEEVARRNPTVPPPPGTHLPPLKDATLGRIESLIYLSAVGFSPDHRRALVYMATAPWGGGQYYFLVKRHGEWVIDKDYRGSVGKWVA